MWISKAFYLLVGTSFYITSTIAALGGPSQASSSLDHEAAGAQQQEIVITASSGVENHSSYYSWYNWDETVSCAPHFLAYPSSLDEVSALVQGHARVRVVGLGHSFNHFCSDDLMISTTQLNKVLFLDDKALTVTTQPGVKTRNLMDWLARRGYSLPTVPFFVDQTIGGVVSTGSHGSSIRWGSVSNIVKALKIVVHDGSVRTITEADGDVFKAASLSVGFLGVLVEVTLKIVPDIVVKRELDFINDEDLLNDLLIAEKDSLKLEGCTYWYMPSIKTAAKAEIHEMSHMEHHVHTPQSQTDVGRALSDLYYRTIANSSLETPYNRFCSRLLKHKNPAVSSTFMLVWHVILSVLPGYYKLSTALPQQQVVEVDLLRRNFGKYDQAEFAVALDKAHACMTALFTLMDTDPTFRDDFRVPICLRYVGPDTSFLSMSRAGTRFFLNFDDYDVYNKGGYSASFQAVKNLMASPICEARIHFGKTALFSGQGGEWNTADAEYAKATVGYEAWERFNTVVKILDPMGKFSDHNNILIEKPLLK